MIATVIHTLLKEPLYWLLAAVPVAIVLELSHAPPLWIFIVSCIAIVPLAGLMGRSTENLAESFGAGIGGLLNATFGNAAELIIALVALWAAAHDPNGPHTKHALVKASIIGSIIGNILLVLGLAMFAGGCFYRKQTFNSTAASMGATLLALATIGLVFPTLHYTMIPLTKGRPLGSPLSTDELKSVELLSEEIAAVLLLVYLLSLWFSLRTHQHLFAGPEHELPTMGEKGQPEWSRRTALGVLLLSTAGVALISELLVGSVEEAAESLGMTSMFIGIIVVAVVGNAAEHSTAILVAMKNKMDLAVTIAVGSSIQIALFVAPVLVFASLMMNPSRPLDLHFTMIELVTVILSVGVVALVAQDGETHWMEGIMLLAVYGIIALAIYHLPEVTPLVPHAH